MKLVELHRQADGRWSAPLPHELDGPSTLVLAFGQRNHPDVAVAAGELAAAFPRSVVVGCSGAGAIAERQVADLPLCVAVARFERSRIAGVSTPIEGVDDSQAAGRRLADALPKAGLRAVLVFASGIDVNGAALVSGMQSGLPEGTPISGGLAGDDSRFERTWVLGNGAMHERAVAAVGLYGETLRIGHGCDGGWQDFGPVRTITRASGNVLHELDGKPALALYKDYLGELADKLPGSALLFPMSIRCAGDEELPVVRTILGIDEASQSMTFAAEMPVGSSARLMRTTIDRLAVSAEGASRQALETIAGDARQRSEPLLAISVSCVGRRLIMGERTDEELEALTQNLPDGSVLAGFYSYGEIAPQQGCLQGALHNQTMTVTVIAET